MYMYTGTFREGVLPCYISLKSFTKTLHQNPSPKSFTKILHQNPSPKSFTKILHQNPSPKSFTKILVLLSGKETSQVQGTAPYSPCPARTHSDPSPPNPSSPDHITAKRKPHTYARNAGVKVGSTRVTFVRATGLP